MNTYYTKCGREFQKSSTAGVTGYKMAEDDQECLVCPFRTAVNKGWPEVFDHWECRAGSQPPSQKDDWHGSLDDKNSISIRSLHNDFLEAVMEYCKGADDLSAAYTQDREDCRRAISVSCSSNKKGIAAKKKLIEKFFHGAAVQEEEECEHCEDCGRSLDEGESIDWIKCTARMGFVMRKQKACNKFEAEFDPDWPNLNCIDCKFCVEDECIKGVFKNCCPSRIKPGVKACWMFRRKELAYTEESKEVNELKCIKHHCPFNNDEISECGFNPTTDDAHRKEMEEAKSQYHCTNKQLLEVLESLPKYVSNYEDRITSSQWIKEALRCTSRDESCGYYCKHNEGCSLVLVTGDTLIALMNRLGEHDCNLYRLAAKRNLGKALQEEVEMELVEPEDRYTKEPAPTAVFDYSTVDTETSSFLQEKEQKITQIRMMSVMAIGKELKEVHEKLANNKTGTFMAWCKSLGMSWDTANNYLRSYTYISENFGHIEDAENIQPSLLFAISKPSAPAELQKAVLDGDITTHKQYKELEAQFKAKEEEKEWEEQQAEEYALKASKERERADKAEKELKTREQEANVYRQSIRNLQNRMLEANESGDKGLIDNLQKQLAEAQEQVEKLQQEINQPGEIPTAAVIEKVPEAVEQELESFRKKAILLDYEKVDDALNDICEIEDDTIKNWALRTCTGYGQNRWKTEIEDLQALSEKISFMMKCLEEQANQNK